MALSDREPVDVVSLDRHAGDAGAETVEVDSERRLLLLGLALHFGFRVTGLCGFGFLLLCLRLALGLLLLERDLVRLRREWALPVLLQGHGVDPGRAARGEVPLEGADLRGEVAVRGVEEELALGVPGGGLLVEEIVRHPADGAVRGAPDMDRARLVGVGHREGQVGPLGGPGVVADHAALVVGDLDQLPVGEGQDEELAVLVREGEVRALGRPLRGEGHALASLRHLLRPAARLVHEPDLVLAAAVGDERDPLPVGRPAGQLVVNAGRGSEVARCALLDGQGEDVAAGHEERPLALRAELEALDLLLGAHPRGPHGDTVVRHEDRNRLIGLRPDVVDAQLAVQLVDDAGGVVGGRPAHVPRRARRELRDRVGLRVPGVEVERAVAIGGEVDRVADPHGVALRALARGEGLRVVRGEVVDVEVLRPAALVALPGTEVAEERRVRDPLAVGREIARARRGHGQGLRQAALRGDREELALRADAVGVALRAEEDRAAVGRPAHDLVVVAAARGEGAAGGVVGELPRLASLGRDHVDLLVTLVLAGEGDPLSVGGELREELEAGVGGEPGGGAPLGGGGPDVARVTEGDAVARDVGKAQELRLGRGGGGQEARAEDREQSRGRVQSNGHDGTSLTPRC